MDKKNFRGSWFGSVDRAFQPQIDTDQEDTTSNTLICMNLRLSVVNFPHGL